MRKGHVSKCVAALVASFAVFLSGCDASGELLRYLSDGASIETDKEGPSAEKTKVQLEKVRLIRVVDGDTLLAEIEETETYVRLIGINAPESVASDEYLEKTGKENTQEGREASEFVKELLTGQEWIWLEYDEEKKDQYERTLAYVWLSEDASDLENMLNARLVAEGYARPMTIKPNVRHAQELSSLADDGR